MSLRIEPSFSGVFTGDRFPLISSWLGVKEVHAIRLTDKHCLANLCMIRVGQIQARMKAFPNFWKEPVPSFISAKSWDLSIIEEKTRIDAVFLETMFILEGSSYSFAQIQEMQDNSSNKSPEVEVVFKVGLTWKLLSLISQLNAASAVLNCLSGVTLKMVEGYSVMMLSVFLGMQEYRIADLGHNLLKDQILACIDKSLRFEKIHLALAGACFLHTFSRFDEQEDLLVKVIKAAICSEYFLEAAVLFLDENSIKKQESICDFFIKFTAKETLIIFFINESNDPLAFFDNLSDALELVKNKNQSKDVLYFQMWAVARAMLEKGRLLEALEVTSEIDFGGTELSEYKQIRLAAQREVVCAICSINDIEKIYEKVEKI